MNARLLAVVIVIVAALVVLTVAVCGTESPGHRRRSRHRPRARRRARRRSTPSAALIAKATKARKAAVRARARLSRVRRCFRDKVPVRVYPAPNRGALKVTWEKALRRWRHAAKDWRQKYRDGRERMRNPGGTSNGVRWKPLMRWVGWPESCLSQLAAIVMRESSGRARAYNPSGAAGLCQLMPGWYRGQWGIPAGNPFDPEYNLRSAYLMWRKCGFSPWAL